MDAQSRLSLENLKALARAEKYREAEEILRELLERYPREAQIHAAAAYVRNFEGRTLEAIAEMSEAIRINPDEPAFYFTRGRWNVVSERYAEAIEDLSETIRLSAHYQNEYYAESAYFFRAEAFLRGGDFERARADCAHVRAGFRLWVRSLRTREEILAECEREGSI
jgi:tetratricopeptide (TPR) repeat protein